MKLIGSIDIENMEGDSETIEYNLDTCAEVCILIFILNAEIIKSIFNIFLI